jgi:hypothetical protein
MQASCRPVLQTETLAQLAALQQLRSLDLLCTLFVGPGRTMPADLTDWHFSAIPGHLTRLTHLVSRGGLV